MKTYSSSLSTMASLMGVAFMLSSQGTICAESSGEPNNQDKICYYKEKCPTCKSGKCDKDNPPENKPVPVPVTDKPECPSDPTEVGLDDSYELTSGGARSLRSGRAAAAPTRIAGGFSPDFVNPKNLKVFGDGAEIIRDADTYVSETVPGNQTTSYQYDDYNHVAKIVLRDGSEQHQAYDAQGNIIRKWGSLHYPVSYTYNEYGKLTGMTTYRAAVSDTADWPEGAQGDQCSWIYEPETGYLLEKKYPNGKGVSFTYTPGGKSILKPMQGGM